MTGLSALIQPDFTYFKLPKPLYELLFRAQRLEAQVLYPELFGPDECSQLSANVNALDRQDQETLRALRAVQLFHQWRAAETFLDFNRRGMLPLDRTIWQRNAMTAWKQIERFYPEHWSTVREIYHGIPVRAEAAKRNFESDRKWYAERLKHTWLWSCRAHELVCPIDTLVGQALASAIGVLYFPKDKNARKLLEEVLCSRMMEHPYQFGNGIMPHPSWESNFDTVGPAPGFRLWDYLDQRKTLLAREANTMFEEMGVSRDANPGRTEITEDFIMYHLVAGNLKLQPSSQIQESVLA